MSNIDAAAHACVHLPDCGEHVQRRGEVLILGPMVMDADPDVVLLHEFLHPRKRLMGGSGDDQGYSGSLAVLKFFPDVLIVVVRKRDRATCAQIQAGGPVLCRTWCYLIGGRHRGSGERRVGEEGRSRWSPYH